MNNQSPRFLSKLRMLVPLAVLALVLAGATAAFASGAFESNDSGFDSARDIAERGTVSASTTTSSLPESNDDRGNGTPSAASSETRTEDQTSVPLPDGTTQTFAAGGAGSVTIRRTGSALSIVSVNANAGWSAEVEQGSGPEVEVKFVDGATRIDFSAEFEDGAVRVRVRSETPDASSPASFDSRDDNSGSGDDSGSDDDGDSGSGHDDGSSNSGSGDSGSSNSGSGHSGSGHDG